MKTETCETCAAIAREMKALRRELDRVRAELRRRRGPSSPHSSHARHAAIFRDKYPTELQGGLQRTEHQPRPSRY